MAGHVLGELAAAARNQDLDALAGSLTASCRSSCPGLVPHLVAAGPSLETAAWYPSTGSRGGLLESLGLLIASYARIERVELAPLKMLDYGESARLRARLRIAGRDAMGPRRVDEGLLDLELRRGPAGWKVHRVEPGPLHSVRRSAAGPSPYRALALPGRAAAGQPGRSDAALPGREEVDLRLPGQLAAPVWAVLDVDGDGQLDLVRGRDGEIVYWRRAGRGFARARALGPSCIGGPVRALAAADFDGDGRMDIFAGCFGGRSRIWMNRGGGRFEPLAGLDVRGHVTAAAVADFDGDGTPDIYVVRHAPHAAASSADPLAAGEPNLLFLGNDRGGLELAAVRGAAADRGLGLGVCAADFDDDGRVDLFVANELGPSRLLRNKGGGQFEELGRRAGLELPGLATACAAGDFDGDGRLDLFVAVRGTAEAYLFGRPGLGAPGYGPLPDGQRRRRLEELLRGRGLWINRAPDDGGDLRFERVSFEDARWFRGVAALDHDADGRLDLLLSPEPNRGTFERRWWWDVLDPLLRGRAPAPLMGPGVAPAGSPSLLVLPDRANLVDLAALLELPPAHGAFAALDMAGNGLLDLAVETDSGPVLLRWTGPGPDEGAHALLVKLEAPGPNRDCLGCRVEITAEGRRQVREVGAASGLPAGPPGLVHFGLGSALRVEEARVRWPGGMWVRYVDLPVDRTIVLRPDGSARWRTAEDPGGEGDLRHPDEELDFDPDPDQDQKGQQDQQGNEGHKNQKGVYRPGRAVRRGEGRGAGAAEAELQGPDRHDGAGLELGALAVTEAGRRASLARWLGPRGTLLLVAGRGCRSCAARCGELAARAAEVPGVVALGLTMTGARRPAGCALPWLRLDPGSARLLGRQTPVLPVVILIDGQGRTLRFTGGSISAVQLEADLSR